jgi:hypothetical protein
MALLFEAGMMRAFPSGRVMEEALTLLPNLCDPEDIARAKSEAERGETDGRSLESGFDFLGDETHEF